MREKQLSFVTRAALFLALCLLPLTSTLGCSSYVEDLASANLGLIPDEETAPPVALADSTKPNEVKDARAALASPPTSAAESTKVQPNNVSKELKKKP